MAEAITKLVGMATITLTTLKGSKIHQAITSTQKLQNQISRNAVIRYLREQW